MDVTANGHFGGIPPELAGHEHTINALSEVPDGMVRLGEVVANAIMTRGGFFNEVYGNSADRKQKAVEEEAGYPARGQDLGLEDYQDLYNFNPIAGRVVENIVRGSWRVWPQVYDSDEGGEKTAFEEAVRGLGRQLRGDRSYYRGDLDHAVINEYLKRLDTQAGINQYAVLLIGTDDGLDLSLPAKGLEEEGTVPVDDKPPPLDEEEEKVPPALRARSKPTSSGTTNFPYYSLNVNEEETRPEGKPGRKLKYLRVFPQTQAPVAQWESNPTSERYGQPVSYNITFNAPTGRGGGSGYSGAPTHTQRVHWTRVLHFADNIQSNECLGSSRMAPVRNTLLDLRKMYAASPVSYWKNCMMALSIETNSALGTKVNLDVPGTKKVLADFWAGLDRALYLKNLTAKPIAPAVVDPKPHIEVAIEAICIRIDQPVRIFKGSERGELASNQDSEHWDSQCRTRQMDTLTPRLIIPFYDRLIDMGVLPVPQGDGYEVFWPDLKEENLDARYATAQKFIDVLSKYVAGDLSQLLAPIDLLVSVLGLDQEEAEGWLENAVEALEEKQQQDLDREMDQQQQKIDAGLAPDPSQMFAPPGSDGGVTKDGVPVKGDEPPAKPVPPKPPKVPAANQEWIDFTTNEVASIMALFPEPPVTNDELTETDEAVEASIRAATLGRQARQLAIAAYGLRLAADLHRAGDTEAAKEAEGLAQGYADGVEPVPPSLNFEYDGEGNLLGVSGDELEINFNPYHDAKGRFAPKPGGKVGGGISGSGVSRVGTGGGIKGEPQTPPPPGNAFKPRVEHDSDGDGVTDASRVGVPARSVPPPPPIPKLPNLTPHERRVEQDFIRAYESDPDGVARRFREVVSASAKPGEPPTYGTDDAKVLTEAWSHPDQGVRSQNRATLNLALHQTANAIAKRAFVHELDELNPGDEIMVTVGGCGAGKGYALKNVPVALEAKGRAKVVWDSAGDQNATENPWIQQEAERRGLKVSYVYVHADPETQWAHPERGVVKRAADPADGRMVDAKVFADSYALGAKNHQAFYEANKGNPNARFLFLANKGKPTLLDGIPEEALKVDRIKLAKFAVEAVNASDAPAHVKRGGTIGERIWGLDH